jgi:Transglycosylase SLT domain
MRLPSLAWCRRALPVACPAARLACDTGPGGVGRVGRVGRGQGPSPRRLACAAVLLLMGLAGGLTAQPAEPALGPGAEPRAAGLPERYGGGVAAQSASQSERAAQAALCRALLAEVVPAGAGAALAGAAGLPVVAFAGFSDTLQAAAEPPPSCDEPAGTGAGAFQAGEAGVQGRTGAGTGAPAAAASGSAAAAVAGSTSTTATGATSTTSTTAASTGTATVPQPATAPAAPPPPPPEPHPPLGFNASLGVPHKPFGKLIYQIARNYALNPLLVAAMVQVESDFNPRARSRKGACGLMQVLPETARRFGMPRRRDLFNPRKNLETASRYLRWLVNRFGDDPLRVLAAYNAGEGAVERFGGVPPFAETRGYVQRIFSQLGFSALLDPPAGAAAAGGGR